MLKMILDAGHVVPCTGLLSLALCKKQTLCVDLILNSGYDVCENDCFEFMTTAKIKEDNYENCKWFNEVGGCKHRHTWEKVRMLAWESLNRPTYSMMSKLLDLPDDGEGGALIIKYHLIDSDISFFDRMVCLNGFRFKPYFPELSPLVKSLTIYDRLTKTGCRIIPCAELFMEVVKQNKTEYITIFLRRGLVVNKELFEMAKSHFNYKVDISAFLKMFKKKKVDVHSDRTLWWELSKAKNKTVLLYLIDTSDKEELFNRDDIIGYICAHDELLELVYHLVELGLPKDSLVLLGDCYESGGGEPCDTIEFIKFIHEKEPAVPFDLDNFIWRCYDNDVIEYVVKKYVDPDKLTDDQILSMGRMTMSTEYKNILESLEATKTFSSCFSKMMMNHSKFCTRGIPKLFRIPRNCSNFRSGMGCMLRPGGPSQNSRKRLRSTKL